jgi:hypothetical protein
VSYALAIVALIGAPSCTFKASGKPDNTPDGSNAVDAAIDAPTPAGWFSAQFQKRRLVTVDNAMVGSALTRFPVLVTLAQADNDSLLGSSSSDVRFVGSDDATVLPYDVDTGSAAGALFWVPIDIPPGMGSGSAAAPTFYVYFDDVGTGSAAGPKPNAPAVWSSYVSVHHLGGTFDDVTGHRHDGMPLSVPTTPTAAPGQIGIAAVFGGSAAQDSIPLPTDASYDLATALSISVWVELSAWQSTFECVVCKGDSAWRVHRGNGSQHPDFGSTPLVGGTAGNVNLDNGANINDSQWHLLGVEYDGMNKTISVDGGPPAMMASGPLATNTQQVVIGRNVEAVNPADRYFDGMIDELRIGATLRGPGWFAAEKRAATDASFVTLGPIEQIP